MDEISWRRREGWTIAGLIAASGLILFFNLWARSLENHDYLRYAEVAREMIRSGDWIVPRYNGEVYLDKPPLLLWLIALPAYLHGSVTPFIARLPSALAAWIGILVLFFWGRRMYGTNRAGILSAGILLSCYQYFSQARSAKTDVLLCLFILLSLYFSYLGYGSSRKKRTLFFSFSFFFMGLGVLTKGPFGFLIPFPILALFLVKEKRARILLSGEFLLGYLILVLVALPWPLLFVGRFGLQESIALVRQTHPLTRQAPFYFYFIEIWGQFAPWSLLLPILGYSLWKEKSQVWQSGESLCLIWFVLLFLLLTLFKVRASRYLLPAIPPLALMLGGRWKKRASYFVAAFLVMILIWQFREINWMRKDASHSPGRLLAAELRPAIRGSVLHCFQLDISTLEELNFYFDPVAPLPVFKQVESLTAHLAKEGKGWALMPEKTYGILHEEERQTLTRVRMIPYKKEKLVLLFGP